MGCDPFQTNQLLYFSWKEVSAYPNLVRTQVEIISDPIYLVRIVFER